MDTIRDRIWMYGAVCGAYHTTNYKIPGVNTMDCAAACRKYGVTKAVMDVCVKGPFYPFDAESEKLSFLDELVWTVIPSGSVIRNEDGFFDMEEIIRQIQRYPNVKGVFCDDFQYRRRSICPPGKLMEMKKRILDASPRPLDMRLVYYATDIFTERVIPHHIFEYSGIADVLSFWTWHPFHLKVMKDNLAFLVSKVRDRKVNLGIYLWDFSAGRPLDDKLMEYQLDMVLELLHSGQVNGVMICASCIMGVGIHAEEIFAQWLKKHGDEIISAQPIVGQKTLADNERL